MFGQGSFDLGQHLLTRHVLSSLIHERSGAPQLAVYAVPVADLQTDGIDPERLSESA